MRQRIGAMLLVVLGIGLWVLPLAAAAAVTNPPAAAAFTPHEIGRVDELLKLMQERLELAPAIAEMRWKTMSRIEDDGSERALLEAVRRQSAALRLDAELALRFAQAQIDAGKIIQAERHKHWAAEPARSPKRLHVANPLRASTSEPELGVPLLTAFRDALDVLRRRGARNLLDARAADLIKVGGPDLLAAQAAMRPLYELAN
jgi:chorismate mutase